MKEDSVIHLEAGSLPDLEDRLPVPRYDRSALRPAILHIGVGGFHRAHMAAYTDEIIRRGRGDWGIHGVGLTPADGRMAETLRAQDGLYTLVARGPEGEEARVIGAITRYFHAPGGAGRLAEQVAAGDYRILSLTVTENGYRYTGDDRHLDVDDPAVARDLREPENPHTVVGFLFRVAQCRIRDGRPLPAFLSCDNLPHNGSVLRNLVLQYAREVDRDVETALADAGAFPNCMVDRITPTTTDADRRHVRQRWGIEDAWPVVCEDFRQWFIEDRFPAGRPDWAAAGAVFVPDVTPYELMKIRLLNGSHSALAYVSYLLGYRIVHEAMNDPDTRELVRRYMAEVEPTVGSVPGVDLERYREKLIERFSNPAIADQVLRLCQDGSRKIPNMILSAMQQLADRGEAGPHGAFAVAAWIRFLRGEDEQGQVIPVEDPDAAALQEVARRCREDIAPFLALASVFPRRLREDASFPEQTRRWYREISEHGTRAALRRLLQE